MYVFNNVTVAESGSNKTENHLVCTTRLFLSVEQYIYYQKGCKEHDTQFPFI